LRLALSCKLFKMRTKILLLPLFIGTLISCQPTSEKSELTVFKSPQIVNSQLNDSIKSTLYQAEYVSEVFPTFVWKFKFQEEIDINPEKRDTTVYKDFIDKYSRRGLTDSLGINGLELIVDYDNSVKYNRYYQYDSSLYDHYPVYFVNSTQTDKVFYGKDSYVFGIQEAVDNIKYGEWRPIEGRGFDFCGNGRWGLIVHPQEFILVLMRKYEGDYETKMRVRFEVGENIFVSRPFKGRINEHQFSIQDSSYLEKRLQETNGKAATWLFYGAVPKEEEWAVKTF
jgi:hypothetical protein